MLWSEISNSAMAPGHKQILRQVYDRRVTAVRKSRMAGRCYVTNGKMTFIAVGDLAPAEIPIPQPEYGSGGPQDLPRRRMVESVVGSRESLVDMWRCETVVPWVYFFPTGRKGFSVAMGAMSPTIKCSQSPLAT